LLKNVINKNLDPIGSGISIGSGNGFSFGLRKQKPFPDFSESEDALILAVHKLMASDW
jgi:hypothetical protein